MSNGGLKITLKVIPNAPHNEVAGWRGKALTIKLTAPPRDGRANSQLRDFLADLFGVSPVDVALVQGETSRRKVVRIAGLSAAEARRRLDPHLD